MRGCSSIIGVICGAVWTLGASVALFWMAFLPAVEKLGITAVGWPIFLFLFVWLLLVAYPGYAIYDAFSGRRMSRMRRREWGWMVVLLLMAVVAAVLEG